MNLPNAITETLGAPDSVLDDRVWRDKPSECKHDFAHAHANRITTQYRVIDTNQYLVKQVTYCNHRGCSSRLDKMWYIDEPFDWNTNPPIVEGTQ